MNVQEVAQVLASAALEAVDDLLLQPDDDRRPYQEAAQAVLVQMERMDLMAVAGQRALLSEALEAVRRLHNARAQAAVTAVALAEAEHNLKVEKAQAEARAVEAAGGEKALGPNADARQRALIIAAGEDQAFRRAHEDYLQALLAHRNAEAQAEAEAARVRVLTAALQVQGR